MNTVSSLVMAIKVSKVESECNAIQYNATLLPNVDTTAPAMFCGG